MMRTRRLLLLLALCLSACLLGALAYNLPPVHAHLGWRVANLKTRLKYALNPPQDVVFVRQEQAQRIVEATIQALTPAATATSIATSTTESLATLTPTVSPTPIPEKVFLAGVAHEYQKFNNCGPANLAMALHYWGWQGDQMDTAAYLRPDERDKNVMPGEMATFVEEMAGLKAVVRVGGDLQTLKRFIAAGYPVIIEKGHHPPKDWWMGHYLVLSGYDDENTRFIAQDSLVMADLKLPYEEIEQRWWRDFNYVYLVIYPQEREAQVYAILGSQADETANFQHALQKALDEIPLLKGRDLFFAWYNLGTNRVALGDYTGAAMAYDQAFALYRGLPEADRPYRMLWYQVGPYPAYYHTGSYQDVINLANTTFAWVGEPVLEETYYWRAMAQLSLGEADRAIADFKKAARLNPNSTDALEMLKSLGVDFP